MTKWGVETAVLVKILVPVVPPWKSYFGLIYSGGAIKGRKNVVEDPSTLNVEGREKETLSRAKWEYKRRGIWLGEIQKEKFRKARPITNSCLRGILGDIKERNAIEAVENTSCFIIISNKSQPETHQPISEIKNEAKTTEIRLLTINNFENLIKTKFKKKVIWIIN